MEVSEYFQIIRERRRDIVLITLVTILVVFLFSIVQKPIYKASALIEVQPSDAGSSFLGQLNLPSVYSQPERQLSTQADLVTAEPLALMVIDKLNLKMTPEEFTKKVSVSAGENTDLIEITVADTDPIKASLIANTLTETFLTNTKKAASSEVSKAKDEVSFKMKDIQEDVRLYSRLNNKEGEEGKPGESDENVQSRIAIAKDIYTDLAGKYQQLKILEDLSTGGLKMVVVATTPRRPSSPDIPKNLFLALVLGLAFSGTWVFGTEYLDNTIKNADEVEKYLEIPVLGQIPIVKDKEAEKSTDKDETPVRAQIVHSSSIAAEAYRSLRTNIQFINFDSQARSIIITSPTAGDGKTTVATNLATTLSLAGSRVILVDCDLRHPKVHEVVDLDNTLGLSNVLVKSHDLNEVTQEVGDAGLSVITSGPKPPNPSELLGSGRMSELIQFLKEKFDYVIIDTPPVCAVTDAVVLAGKVEGVVLICSLYKTTREAAIESRRSLEKVNSKLMGAVINKVDHSRRYGYYSRYGGYSRYGHYYGQYHDEEKDRTMAS
ncbi:MAG TPA: polysaccharide biosynthesis tyrosine autokinase [Actinobacteria bacterium]|nr:polysaccharide biosynthesis tyrosine autokinase [Actinomycetota bacterium]